LLCCFNLRALSVCIFEVPKWDLGYL